MNRLLVYAGSFNPPHLGHEALLRHGLKHSDIGMNVIAGIILPSDDESLYRKLQGERSPLVFTQAERVKTLNSFVRYERCWTYDGRATEFDDFQKHFTKAVRDDGFDLEWVALCGPDYVGVNHVPLSLLWGCDKVVVSDVGRPADFTSPAQTRLTTLKGCDDWEEIKLDFKVYSTYPKEVADRVYSKIFTIAPKYAQQMLDKVSPPNHTG